MGVCIIICVLLGKLWIHDTGGVCKHEHSVQAQMWACKDVCIWVGVQEERVPESVYMHACEYMYVPRCSGLHAQEV